MFLTVKQELSIIITIKQDKARTSLHHLVPKFSVPSAKSTNLTFNNKWTLWMICKVKLKNSALLVLIYSCSIYQTVWKILSSIIYLKSLELFYQQEWWHRKMENPKESDSLVLITLSQRLKQFKKWMGSKFEAKDLKFSSTRKTKRLSMLIHSR